MFTVAVVVFGELWINKLISFDADFHALLGGRCLMETDTSGELSARKFRESKIKTSIGSFTSSALIYASTQHQTKTYRRKINRSAGFARDKNAVSADCEIKLMIYDLTAHKKKSSTKQSK